MPTTSKDTFNTMHHSAPLSLDHSASASNNLLHTQHGTKDIESEIEFKIEQINPEALILNQLISDTSTQWQIHNCKLTEIQTTQDEPLPFLYHYDALTDDIKQANPLTPELLKLFNTPFHVEDVAKLLDIDASLIQKPWQIKVLGTLVMFSERLQIALRLKFTNTAKSFDPIYTKDKDDAIKTGMKRWHFYGDVFVINKSNLPIVVTDGHDNWQSIEKAVDYQVLPPTFALTILALLEEYKDELPMLDDAILQRLI